ncbi:MAG: prepilin-type N-terminal cleavage/methylation domain-containing protein [Sulfurospirillaceae bacterium]|jgi:prepilin-type N-terminal cleavage/methylation domain-containing protein|nr:prepilin-type N-terminal cleavage/methylation domain-containing protein [Sulfurospirillaceae bacterium]MDD2827914.1 prepilin-type N-terminal cleavage/methylation domain-containing protein [Sulfurospirillaceae bacterium]
MKKAFTMIELVFVIVIIGILSYFAAAGFQRNTLQEAADQLVSHIRYTQHLAMISDKFDSKDQFWFLERWTIRIKQDLVYSGAYVPNGTYSNMWAYSVYSDTSHDGNPNLSEMAKNPLNGNQYLSGGYNNTLHAKDSLSMKELRLGEDYGIQDVTFGGGCRSTVPYIHFDYLGRPMNSYPTSYAYELPAAGWHKLLTSQCLITLCDKICTDVTANKISIVIEPETGYTHIQ